MARLAYMEPQAASGEVASVYRILGGGNLPAFLPNSFKLLAHSPNAMRWFYPFWAAVHAEGFGSSVPLRLKELAIVKTSMINSCAYCVSHNLAFGRASGLREEQLEALQGDYLNSGVFDEREKAVIRWAEALTRMQAKRDDDAFQAMKLCFTDREIVEISLVAGLFNMYNRLQEAFHTDLDAAEDLQDRRPTVDAKRMLAYIRAAADDAEVWLSETSDGK